MAPTDDTLLVVDDDLSMRDLMSCILTTHGYRVLAAADGCEALTRYGSIRDQIRLVLLDVIMPRMDGEETLAHMKKINPHVRVLVTSGSPPEAYPLLVSDPCVVGFIAKPFTASGLVDSVRTALAERNACPTGPPQTSFDLVIR